jgi:hypothetical protein
MASMNATKTPENGSHRSGKKKGRVNGRKTLAIEELIATERTALLAERQTEVESVLDTHDTLVSVQITYGSPRLICCIGSGVVSAREIRDHVVVRPYGKSVCLFRLLTSVKLLTTSRLQKQIVLQFGTKYVSSYSSCFSQ